VWSPATLSAGRWDAVRYAPRREAEFPVGLGICVEMKSGHPTTHDLACRQAVLVHELGFSLNGVQGVARA
jgi:hypothetical protein